uniref:Fatty acid desaturase domain-containing protein n=1 Tax=Timema genevievae TaxID=629358 RepID=A0A7R9PRM4_TIMGE|nr:unnamed protein product [Timema genevievae]
MKLTTSRPLMKLTTSRPLMKLATSRSLMEQTTSRISFLVVYSSGFGITAGAHRLWSHRAYKARWPLKLLLIILFTVAGQVSGLLCEYTGGTECLLRCSTHNALRSLCPQRHVYAWALDHRVHHKFSETDADPHNAKRGFLFSHVGWLVLTPHPDVVAKRALVDMSDLEEDMFVVWHKRLYVPLFAIFVLAVPVLVPWYFWDETLWNCFFVMFNSRFCITLNIAFFVNSVAHMWGNRPYDNVPRGLAPQLPVITRCPLPRATELPIVIVLKPSCHSFINTTIISSERGQRSPLAFLDALINPEGVCTGSTVSKQRSISPVENLAVSLAALGEGWHNYHHVFPWDYKTAELGDYTFNLTTAFIDMFAKIGWAYDLKSVSPDMVKRRVERSGDGSHGLWGWGDKDMSEEDRREFEDEDRRWFEEEDPLGKDEKTVVRSAADKHKAV